MCTFKHILDILYEKGFTYPPNFGCTQFYKFCPIDLSYIDLTEQYVYLILDNLGDSLRALGILSLFWYQNVQARLGSPFRPLLCCPSRARHSDWKRTSEACIRGYNKVCHRLVNIVLYYVLGTIRNMMWLPGQEYTLPLISLSSHLRYVLTIISVKMISSFSSKPDI